FKVQVLEYQEEKLADLGNFAVEILDSENFRISNEDLNYDQKAAFGTTLELAFGKIIITPNFQAGKEKMDKTVLVTFGSLDGVVESYRSRLQVNLTDKNSTLIELALQDAVREKARDILDRLIRQYNQEAIEDKNQVSLSTAEFIEERLDITSEELDSGKSGKEEIKSENPLTGIQSQWQLFIENAGELRKEQMEEETKLELTPSMIRFLHHEEKEGSLMPANLGFS